MDEPGFELREADVVIIGLGLMGGSLALNLKGRCRRLRALDNDVRTLELARRKRLVQTAGSDPAEMLPGAQLVILACPVPDIITWLARLPQFILGECVVLDLGSTKRAILSAMQKLPERFDPLGGHAICGKEKLSLENAERSLFKNAAFVFTSLERTGARARSAARQLIECIGARPFWLDAQTHDRALAATSHLPFLLASALCLGLPRGLSSELVGPGLRSTARLAGTPSSMMVGVLQTNRDHLLNEIDQFEAALLELKTALQNPNPAVLKSLLDTARARYLEVIQ